MIGGIANFGAIQGIKGQYLSFKGNAEANVKDWKTARKHRRRKGKGTNGPGLQVAGVCDALDGKSNFNTGVAQTLP